MSRHESGIKMTGPISHLIRLIIAFIETKCLRADSQKQIKWTIYKMM